ncbi:MAG: hypothetical protein OEL83_03560 [Desulforhopalus sp.]|nr:hypothetical protein [Desulforhopalus sp.]
MKNIWLIVFIAVLLTACGKPTGTVYFNKISNGTLQTPYQQITVTDQTAISPILNNKTADGSNVFSIYLTDAYFKYLPDFGGLSEVVIIAEFQESPGAENTITTILGPYRKMADRSGSPFKNKLIYGPKVLESDHLSVKFTILEYDQEEANNSSAMLDFIAGAANTLFLQNPVTQAEVMVVKEIAKALVQLNRNDEVLVLDVDFAVIQDNQRTHQGWNQGLKTIPLQSGSYFVAKQEACSTFTCYGTMSGLAYGKNDNPWALSADVVLAIPTFLVRNTTDSADPVSMADFEAGKVGIGPDNETVVSLKAPPTPGSDDPPYRDKTWLRFAVLKGGDPSQWQFRKPLKKAEKSIIDLQHGYDWSTILKNKDLDKAIENLKQAKALAAAMEAKSAISFAEAKDGTVYLETGNPLVCPSLATGKKINEFKVLSKTSTDKYTVEKLDSEKGGCYRLSGKKTAEGVATPLGPGEYKIQITYAENKDTQSTTDNGQYLSSFFDLVVYDPPSIEKACVTDVMLEISGKNLALVEALQLDEKEKPVTTITEKLSQRKDEIEFKLPPPEEGSPVDLTKKTIKGIILRNGQTYPGDLKIEKAGGNN